MARLSQDVKTKIIAMSANGDKPAKIAKKLGLKTTQVSYVIKKDEPVSEVSDSETVSEEANTDDMDYKAWAEFWKDRYLTAHALLIEHDIIK